jgi:hypothetical protein
MTAMNSYVVYVYYCAAFLSVAGLSPMILLEPSYLSVSVAVCHLCPRQILRGHA